VAILVVSGGQNGRLSAAPQADAAIRVASYRTGRYRLLLANTQGDRQ
jgi:hypothetical protein